jgi:hypothetical protein
MQSSFTGNAKKEAGRTLIEKTVATKEKQIQTSCTNNYSLPFLYTPPPPSRTHILMHAFESSPRHQPQTADYFETTVFRTRTETYLISQGNITTAKKA